MLEIIIVIVIQFYLLGKSANWVVKNIKSLAEKLGLQIFVLGMILGLMTSLPEMAVGLNAVIANLPGISVGNLFGGIIVIFGLILSSSIILNRKIVTDGKYSSILPIFGLLLLPMLLGLKGGFNIIDGLILIFLYFGLFWYYYNKNKRPEPLARVKIQVGHPPSVGKEIIMTFIGVIAVIFFSHLIVRFTSIVLDFYHIRGFITGLIFFSLGTNLPELIVTFSSWRKQLADFSISYLIGSAMGNVLMLGVLACLKDISIKIDLGYYLTLIITALILVSLAFFYTSEKKFVRHEGLTLLFLYFAFLISQIILLVNQAHSFTN